MMERFDPVRLADNAACVMKQNQETHRLDGWFLTQEIRMKALAAMRAAGELPARPIVQARLLEAVCRELPLSIRPGEVFAGSQADAFARTYALINPEFRVETFAGYCDPVAVYGDITPAPELGLTEERIRSVRDFWVNEEYARALSAVYRKTGIETAEVVYFVEQVTGHTVADFRPALGAGVLPMIEKARAAGRSDFHAAAETALGSVLILADRYARLASAMAGQETDQSRRAELERIAESCRQVPVRGARNLHEAIQSLILLWMTMALEQAPNPYAFSVGNLDRVLQPWAGADPETAVGLVRHLLLFFCVGDRNWAISQNVMAGGRDAEGRDLTCEMTEVVLEAFRRNNTPQPNLSVKLHSRTPDSVYAALDPFFTTPGSVTPSLLNDDVLFPVLGSKGIEDADLADYSIAGCQEPLVMGRESGNTTNSWLNLAKILELTLLGGKSAITGKPIGLGYAELGLDPSCPLADPVLVRAAFWRQLDHFLPKMQEAANCCTQALALLPVPFLSSFMGGLGTGADLRDTERQNTKYNASGCLVHGLATVADSFAALEALTPEARAALPDVLRQGFADAAGLREQCLAAPKFGNDDDRVDLIAADVARGVSERVHSLRNPWNRPFLPDWSTPSTHLLYGYWVGATPDGRRARTMLGFGIDPTVGMATRGLPARIISSHKLPYETFLGGYASHIGLDPGLFEGLRQEGFMPAMRRYVMNPLFGHGTARPGGYYAYFNVDTPDFLRRLLADPKRHAPSGVYIMRIHGTFVNFLDLSPAIQEDIIARLDLASTKT